MVKYTEETLELKTVDQSVKDSEFHRSDFSSWPVAADGIALVPGAPALVTGRHNHQLRRVVR